MKKFDYFIFNRELGKIVNGDYEHGITDINSLKDIEIEIYGRKEKKCIGKLKFKDIFEKF